MKPNKDELIRNYLDNQKQYIGQKKDIIEEEKALMDFFNKDKINGELSFIAQYQNINDNKICKDNIDKINEVEALIKGEK